MQDHTEKDRLLDKYLKQLTSGKRKKTHIYYKIFQTLLFPVNMELTKVVFTNHLQRKLTCGKKKKKVYRNITAIIYLTMSGQACNYIIKSKH